MEKQRTPSNTSRTVTRSIREKIARGGERLWKLEDFADLPFTAVAQALSALPALARSSD